MMPDLSPHIGDIARHLLGEPNRQQSNRHQLRFGSNGSIAVEIAGPKCGTWYDHENEVGGSAWELLRRELKLDDAGIRAWLERKGIGPAKANGHSASAKATIVAE